MATISSELAAHMRCQVRELTSGLISDFTGIFVVFTTFLILLASGMVKKKVVWYFIFDCFDCFGRCWLAERRSKSMRKWP